jgi:hypothetical protein
MRSLKSDPEAAIAQAQAANALFVIAVHGTQKTATERV